MNKKEIYQSKLISVTEALAKIKDGDEIISALGAAEPKMIMERLHELSGSVKEVTVVTCLPMGGYEYFTNPAHKESITMEGWFYSPEIRKAHENGNISFIPNHLHLSGKKRLAYKNPNIFVGSASPMDKHGFLSLALSATYEREMMEAADLVILEVNPNVPRTFGDTVISIEEIDCIIEVDYPLSELPTLQPSEKDQVIGKYIADLVEDGSTIQLGIGGIPNAVAAELKSKKDLGIHTEMFTDGMVDLYLSGAVTNRLKTIKPNKMVATFALGSKKLYDFLDDNPAVEILKGQWVNNPYVIGQNHKMISINTTIEIDLTGQCCSESIGHRQFSGTGGQADTAIGAQISPEGKSIIALYSTTIIKDEKGERKTISKIVPTLQPGAAVSLSRNDVDYVVTEYGVAALRGTSIKERVKRLVAIAHPDFRDELLEKARQLKLF
ncbi:acetyl-CoA hydrolase/transferase family protein [Alkaliphilus transvaalensis]|uniref:acetyl-CoA hydrolase/transferase family protein n=1 Tax=Alkaliphilus transvaalensis TaxID=114628 RepID=UPI0004797642|nr:acetyl-CoA hydrolase/transferase C-terminal domain-containing protein [Alkaliphilus transvaalensis]